jgi:hypothetical protein
MTLIAMNTADAVIATIRRAESRDAEGARAGEVTNVMEAN